VNDENARVTRAVLKADLTILEARLLERFEKSETALLREFRKCAINFVSPQPRF